MKKTLWGKKGLAFFLLGLLVAITALYTYKNEIGESYLKHLAAKHSLELEMEAMQLSLFPLSIKANKCQLFIDLPSWPFKLDLQGLEARLSLWGLLRQRVEIQYLKVAELHFQHPKKVLQAKSWEAEWASLFKALPEPDIERDYALIQSSFEKMDKDWPAQLLMQQGFYLQQIQSLKAQQASFSNDVEFASKKEALMQKIIESEQYYYQHLQLLKQEFKALKLALSAKESAWLDAYQDSIPWGKTDLWLNESLRSFMRVVLTKSEDFFLFLNQPKALPFHIKEASFELLHQNQRYHVLLSQKARSARLFNSSHIHVKALDSETELRFYLDLKPSNQSQLRVHLQNYPLILGDFSLNLRGFDFELAHHKALNSQEGHLKLALNDFSLADNSFWQQLFIPQSVFLDLGFSQGSDDLSLRLQSDLSKWLKVAWVDYYQKQRQKMKESFQKKLKSQLEIWEQDFEKHQKNKYRNVQQHFRKLYAAF